MNQEQRFTLATEAHIGTVVLKVANLSQMTAFYTQVIGLTVINKQPRQVTLGVGKRTLLELIQIEAPNKPSRKTGLYHVAFLVPSRHALGSALRHYLQIQAPIEGASDHGYSEALYLTDPEGNGIEVYHDKPIHEWDIRDNGEIHGITVAMDADGVLAAGSDSWDGLASETIVGHVHLKVSDLEKTEAFYTQVLGLGLKSNFGQQAKFFAAGNYHHHIGSNIWFGRMIPAMEANDLGLAYFSFVLPERMARENLLYHLKQVHVSFTQDQLGNIWLQDPNGIKIRVELASTSV